MRMLNRKLISANAFLKRVEGKGSLFKRAKADVATVPKLKAKGLFGEFQRGILMTRRRELKQICIIFSCLPLPFPFPPPSPDKYKYQRCECALVIP